MSTTSDTGLSDTVKMAINIEIDSNKIVTEESTDLLQRNFGRVSLLEISPVNENEMEYDQYRTSKRTVEGSPMFSNKRTDCQSTPNPYRYLLNKPFSFEQPLSATSLPLNRASLLSDIKSVTVFSASESVIHLSGCGHQENYLRTFLLNGPDGCLKRNQLASFISSHDAKMNLTASLADLMRVHDYDYINHLEKKCDEIIANESTVSNQKSPNHPYFYSPLGMLDLDTPLSSESLHAAKMFCGAAMTAVDHVMSVDNDPTFDQKLEPSTSKFTKNRAFVVGRPPGHHAGPSGCVVSENHWKRPDMTSSGFCLLNTVAVAAAYARYNYSHPKYVNWHNCSIDATSTGLRVAIVDIDIHHGNGTEEIVRNLKPHTRYLPLPSSYAPVSAFSYKPWYSERDAEDVFFSSIHLFNEEKFYPGTGRESSNDADSNIVNVCLTPIGPVGDSKARAKLSSKQRYQLHESASREMRQKVEVILLPRLKKFRADLLFISAGFDAHIDDLYHFLDEDDFYWLTAQLCSSVTERGRVVSVMEGGYSLKPPTTQSPSSVTSTRRHPKASTFGLNSSSADQDSTTTSPAMSPSAAIHVGKYAVSAEDGGLVKA